jgi:hypothetical protein
MPTRSPTGNVNKDILKVYHANRIASPDGVFLTWGGLVLVALLSGGDYSAVRVFFFIQWLFYRLILFAHPARVSRASASKSATVWHAVDLETRYSTPFLMEMKHPSRSFFGHGSRCCSANCEPTPVAILAGLTRS